MTIKHLGDLYSDLELSKSADRFLRRNFEDVMDTEGFLELTRDELGTILEGGGALFVKAEDRILEAVVRYYLISDLNKI